MNIVILSFLCLQGAVQFAAGYVQTCAPLSPSEVGQTGSVNASRKAEAVNAYQRGLEPVFFWHLQKMGGSSFCGMNMKELKSRGQPIVKTIDNCNFKKKGYAFKRAVEGQRMVPPLVPWSVLGMEPAYVYLDKFPEAFHREMRSILDTNTVDPFWTTVPNAIAVRSPEQSAMSAFDYVFSDSQSDKSILGSCQAKGHSVEQCMQLAMDVREGLRVPGGMWTAFQLNKIRTQVLGNFITMHLSLNEDVEEAKTNLRRFSLIFDITRGPGLGDLDLIRCVLGWEGVETIGRSNVNTGGGHHSGHAYITDQLSNSTIARVMKYIAKDMKVYAYALELIEEHFKSSGALKHVGSEVHASELSVEDVNSFMGTEADYGEFVMYALFVLGVLVVLLCVHKIRGRRRKKEETHDDPGRMRQMPVGGEV